MNDLRCPGNNREQWGCGKLGMPQLKEAATFLLQSDVAMREFRPPIFVDLFIL